MEMFQNLSPMLTTTFVLFISTGLLFLLLRYQRGLSKASILRHLYIDAQWRTQLHQLKPLLDYLIPVTQEEKRYLSVLLIAISLCIGTGRIIRVSLPLLIARILDSIDVDSTKHATSFPWTLISTYVFIRFFFQEFVNWLQWTLSRRFDNYTVERINIASYNKIMSLSADYQDRKNTVSAWSTVKSSGVTVSTWVGKFVFQLLPDLADLVFSVVSFRSTIGNNHMSIIILLVLTCYAVTVLQTSKRSPEDLKIWRDATDRRDKQSSETISNWWTVSMYGQIDREQRKHRENVIHQRDIDIRFCDQYWFNHNMRNVVMTFGLLWVWLFLSREIWQGIRSKNDLVLLIYIWTELKRPISGILGWKEGLTKLFLELERLLDILKENPTIKEESGAIDYKTGHGNITFRNVSFSYKSSDSKDARGVQDISIDIVKGSTVAVVGRSGGGKSTLLKLIKRFYDADQGEILIGGQNIKHLTLSSLCAGVGLVPQSIGGFSATFLDNVRYPRPNATDEECKAVCRLVGLEDMMEEEVGEGGDRLSGGQLQRLAIARALMQQPDILLLDEATSHLDSETEAMVHEHLQEWKGQGKDRTIVMIAHSFKSILNRDTCHIVAMKDGMIVEHGTESELLAKKGYYHELYTQQVLE